MNIRKKIVSWHRAIGWWALLGIVIWVVSGACHPMMSWFGPKADKFFPPSMQLSASNLQHFPALLADGELLKNARVAKIVPSKKSPLLQITTGEQSARDYYNLNTGEHLTGQDLEQAIWLANYYTGRQRDAIANVVFQTEFSEEYPWVNRLLPVYKIEYSGSDGLAIFIHTETTAMAGLTNGVKTGMQWIFQHFHTFKWLSGVEYGRLIVMALFMLCLCAMALLGLSLILALKARTIKQGRRRYHRWLGYVLWLPLLMWSASGFYHLLQASLVEMPTGIRLGENLGKNTVVDGNNEWLQALGERKVNSLSLVRGEQGELLYRASLASVQPSGDISRSARYGGIPAETESFYVDASTGKLVNELTDTQQVKALAAGYSGLPVSTFSAVDKVTRFGPEYDFRNKRLPVWQVSLNDEEGSFYFIDPVTGVLVDQSRTVDRTERWSFTYLHKWNFLTPFTGRFIRDLLIVFFLGMILVVSVLGVSMMLRRRVRDMDAARSSVLLEP
ncbi:PepSY domain-containing protein [Teredinibacter haidensis]|uniref:PepSY domain-containing protein n=1 Tax=Teredinibacter haidensis TaxID=2731755 RepID=UPI000948CBAB|nr:PepSY domain-containing protein [Teredinibacter haidensis]